MVVELERDAVTRHVLALTTSGRAAGAIERAAREDFTSVQRRLRWVHGYGWCDEISVDADEYDRVVLSSPRVTS